VPPRPKYYVVKDGDTLYKIAIKFYGRVTAWTEIREANKAVVSMDGRIKTGQKLTLP
jgi:nucleoid-associated protein YgaU